MSSNNFTSTFFFRHFEVIAISVLVLLYFHEEIINFFYSNDGITILLLILGFIMVIMYLQAKKSQTKASIIEDKKTNDINKFNDFYNYKHASICQKDKNINKKLDNIFNTITHEAFCPECGSVQKSYNTNFFCEDCEVKFVLEEEVE